MIELINISKKIGKKDILRNISYRFEDGKVYGLCGYNGCGKTMLLRAIAGLITINEGEILTDGKKLHKDLSFPENTGIVIENMELLPQYTAFQNMQMLADIKKIASDEDIIEALKRVGLEENKDTKVKKFSLGMRQRLNIAQAIFEHQNLILLDEPTNALDKTGVELIYRIIREEAKRGAIVIIATHHQQDLESVCDHIIEIENGMIC